VIRVYVEGIGLRGPGLEGWQTGREVLAGRRPYEATPITIPSCDLLPPTERRRVIPSVKLALAVGMEALLQSGRDARSMATVFASSTGDSATIHHILEALASPAREVSPTRFQSSVHNAPAGYWSIATRSHEPSISLCCFNATFAAGLLEAAARTAVERRIVGLIAYDLPLWEPLSALRPIRSSFGTAFLLGPELSERTIGRLDIELRRDKGAASSLDNPEIESLRLDNPVARSLPLLASLSRLGSEQVILDHVGGNRILISIVSRQPGSW
jgi:hypothetical protein